MKENYNTEEHGMIPVAKPLMDEREVRAAGRPILKGWVTQGEEVSGFEKEFARHVGADLACAVSSCTTALHMVLLAVGVKPGDEVITASHSFIATANSIRYCGAVPVFVDIDPMTYNMDPKLVEKAITDNTVAILCVHQLGMPCDLKTIVDIAREHSLKVIEDAACAIGSEILWEGKWEKIGKPRGDAACFSFHPRKVITTGDGGMITTGDPGLDQRLRLLRQHGMSIPDTKRHEAKEVIFESYDLLGYNYRMTDIQAAVGREQLKRIPDIIEKRRYLAEKYRKELGGVPGVILPAEPQWARSNWQSFCVRIPEGCDQRIVMQSMLDSGVQTKRGVMCSHLEPVYSNEQWKERKTSVPSEGLPESERARDKSVILPLFPQMTEEEQMTVIKALKKAVRKGGS